MNTPKDLKIQSEKFSVALCGEFNQIGSFEDTLEHFKKSIL
jgi:hypothetical protein